MANTHLTVAHATNGHGPRTAVLATPQTVCILLAATESMIFPSAVLGKWNRPSLFQSSFFRALVKRGGGQGGELLLG